MEVYPWQVWEYANPRAYPYGVLGFVVLTIVAIIYLVIMWSVGLAFLRTYRLYPSRREYRYLGTGFVVVAFFDTMHVFGDVAFYFTNDSRVPISIGGVSIYYLPLVTSLSVMGIFMFFACLYSYSLAKLEQKLELVDKIFFGLVLIGIALGLNPYNFWHMVPTRQFFDTKPITGMLLVIVGIVAVLKFRQVVIRSVEEGENRGIRVKLITYSLFLLVLLVVLMVPHGMLATLELPWAKITMIIVTIFKLASLATSAVLLYSGTVWPPWAQRFFVKR